MKIKSQIKISLQSKILRWKGWLEKIDIDIKTASVSEAEKILLLQKLTYQSELQLYGGLLIPPLVETLDDLKDKFRTNLFLKATFSGEIIGSVRAYETNGTCHVGRLMVHPKFQNRGIATKLLLTLEQMFSSCARFELFTGSKSTRNIHLYEKLGYRGFKTEKVANNLNLLFLEKNR